MSARDLALELYHAAVAGARPGPATARALRDADAADAIASARRVWLFALGKAAPEMAAQAVAALAESGREIAGGLVVADDDAAAPHAAIEGVRGDHPVPGDRSREAARRLGEAVTRVGPDDLALVLLSGGTTSLVGAPVDGIGAEDHAALGARLLASGLDVGAMNVVRKRFSRWSAGRLAVALSPARVVCLAVSDVVGDEPAAIGSGPCVADPATAGDVRRIAQAAGATLPSSCEALLAGVERGWIAETPKPGDIAFARTTMRVIAGGGSVLRPAAHLAAMRGLRAFEHATPVTGDAAEAGRVIARELVEATRAHTRPFCMLWRGETTVRLDAGAPLGGRCQELALAAAEQLAEAGADVVLLAAGTDGRDGPTDAAGACVDRESWRAIADAGIDPAEALRRHEAHHALGAVGCLLPARATGTNVGDVVIALRT